jgi:hypothetical protein
MVKAPGLEWAILRLSATLPLAIKLDPGMFDVPLNNRLSGYHRTPGASPLPATRPRRLHQRDGCPAGLPAAFDTDVSPHRPLLAAEEIPLLRSREGQMGKT